MVKLYKEQSNITGPKNKVSLLLRKFPKLFDRSFPELISYLKILDKVFQQIHHEHHEFCYEDTVPPPSPEFIASRMMDAYFYAQRPKKSLLERTRLDQAKHLARKADKLLALDFDVLINHVTLLNKVYAHLTKKEFTNLLDDPLFKQALKHYGKPKKTKQLPQEKSTNMSTNQESKEIEFIGSHRLFNRKTAEDMLDSRQNRQRAEIESYFSIKNDSGYRELKAVDIQLFKAVARLKRDFPNCKSLLTFIERQAALCRFNKNKEFTLPPILLVGPPGIGKTAVLRKLGELIDLPYSQLDCGTVTANFIISGNSHQWAGAKPGRILSVLKSGLVANSLIVLDEIDKMSVRPDHDPYGPMYTLLDKEAAQCFTDEFIPEVPIDASKLSIIATANETKCIPEAILSRFTIIEIEALEKCQTEVVISSIYNDLWSGVHHKNVFSNSLSKDVVIELKCYTPRQIKQVLQNALASAAYRMTLSKTKDLIRILPVDLQHIDLEESNPMGFVWK